MTTKGASMIAEERLRQLTLGFDSAFDRAYYDHQLLRAGICYALVPVARDSGEEAVLDNMPEELWPWDARCWKPGSDIRCLVKAGALIAAEIDRRLEANAREQATLSAQTAR